MENHRKGDAPTNNGEKNARGEHGGEELNGVDVWLNPKPIGTRNLKKSHKKPFHN